MKRYLKSIGIALLAANCFTLGYAQQANVTKDPRLTEQAIQRRRDAASRGGGAFSAFGGPNAIGKPIGLFSYEGRFLPGFNEPAFLENKTSVAVPVFKGESDTFALSLAAARLQFSENLSLNSGKAVPRNLFRYEAGAQHYHELADKKNWGLRTTFGYAGDQPFNKAKDMSFSLNAHYGFPGSQNGYWVLMLYLTNNGNFANYIPLPGFLYLYRTPTFTGIFGFPVISLQWTPLDPWAFSLSIFTTNVQSALTYGKLNQGQAFLAYAFAQQNYILSDRLQSRDRLTLQEQKLSVGGRMLFLHSILAELQAGRSFDRSIYEGRGFLNKDRGNLILRSDWFLNWSLKVAF